MDKEIENRLALAELKIEMLNQELYGVIQAIARIIICLDEQQVTGLRNDLAGLANHLESMDKYPDELHAIDAIIDLVDDQRVASAKNRDVQ
ncbi:MAG: hypothetical protein ACYC3N_07825 [Halothiobacillus sp.]